MSIDLKTIRNRVRSSLRDTDSRDALYADPEIDQAIARAYLVLSSRLPAPLLYTANAFSISAGLDTFQLPATVTQWTGNDGGAEYAGALRIQLASSGMFLIRVETEELDAMRNGQPTIQQAVPSHFTLWEESDQDLQGRCYPGAKTTESCHLFRRLTADDLRDFVGSGTGDLDTVEVQFSRIGCVALEFTAALDLLQRLPAQELAARRLSPDVANEWRRQAELSLYMEHKRRNEIADLGRIQRWVS